MTTNKIIVILKDSKTLTYIYALFAFLLTFPTILIVKALATAITIFISIVHLYSHQHLKKEMLNRVQLFNGFILLFLISLSGVLISNNPQNSLDLVIRQLPLLLFPILILKLSSKDYLIVLRLSFMDYVVIFYGFLFLTHTIY